MAEKTIPTKEQVLTTPSRKILFDGMVKGLSIKQAAKEANISYGYARKWVTESNIQALVLCETATKTEDRREQRLRQLDNIIDDTTTSPGIRLKAIDLQGKMCGWHMQTINLETSQRQHELDSKQQEEIRRIALIRHNMLPAQDVSWSDIHQDGKPEQNSLDTNSIEPNPIDGQ